MLLKSNLILTVLMFASSVFAGGKAISTLEAGRYVFDARASNLDEMQQTVNLCADFTIRPQDLTGNGPLNLGSRYAFEIRASMHAVESDINDPTQCAESRFRELNDRTDSDSQTVLKRINEEQCDKKGSDGQITTAVRSITKMEAILSQNRIELHYEMQNRKDKNNIDSAMVEATPLTCVWIRQNQ